MSKKKVRKKSNFKYGSPRPADRPLREETKIVPSHSKAKETEAFAATNNNAYEYVARDLSRVAFLTIALISLQVALWYLVNHTSAVPIYDLIKL